MNRWSRRWLLPLPLSLLAACASYPSQRGVDEAGRMTAARGVAVAGDADCGLDADDRAALSAVPLWVDAAVATALRCNPTLEAGFARLGIARADAWQAARWSNPSINIGRSDPTGAGAATLSLGIAQNFSQLLLRGLRTRLSDAEFLRSQQLLAGQVLELAADTSAAWYRAVAARQIAVVVAASSDLAEVSATLSQRYRDAGNRSARELAIDQSTAVQAGIDARVAADLATTAVLELGLLLGTPAEVGWTLPDALPLPASRPFDAAALGQQATTQRLDLVAARGLVATLADSRDATRRWRWLGDLDAGVEWEREGGRTRRVKPELSIQLPLFDRGDATLARADAWQAWSRAEQRRLELLVANDVSRWAREVETALATVEDHRERLLPQRRNVVARTQEDVNYMLRGAFELFAAKRDEYAMAGSYVAAIADYWVARSQLERAVGARLPSVAGTGSIGAADFVAGAASAPNEGHGHHDHHHDDQAAGQSVPAPLQGGGGDDHAHHHQPAETKPEATAVGEAKVGARKPDTTTSESAKSGSAKPAEIRPARGSDAAADKPKDGTHQHDHHHHDSGAQR